MNETILRVKQALEVKDIFNYVLNNEEIAYLRKNGYIVKIGSDMGFWLYDCIILKGK